MDEIKLPTNVNVRSSGEIEKFVSEHKKRQAGGAQAEIVEKKAAKQHVDWVRRCLVDFEAIKPRMTREQVEKTFPMDGGLQSAARVRLTHPSCQYFKVDVEFDFQRNPNDQNRAIWGTKDRVTQISKPYIQRPVLD